jgi:divalent metal cation (Fe/Co/Zn/Cd) transporter
MKINSSGLMAAAKDNLSDGFKKEELDSVIKSINDVSGVKKIKPLDTKTLTSAIDSLDNILSEVQKLK